MSSITKRRPSEDRASAPLWGDRALSSEGLLFVMLDTPKIVPRSRKTLLFSWDSCGVVGQERGGGILQASKVMGIGGILHAASLRFFDFAISLSFSTSLFYISLDLVDLVVSPLDRIEQSNGHMLHFPSSCRLLFLQLVTSQLGSF